jgi:hypothetical protein
MTIDWSKPVQTRDGRKVRILCTDGPDTKYPVVGFAAESTLHQWAIDGRFLMHGEESRHDLINAPERIKRKVWVNVYPDVETPSLTFVSKQVADRQAGPDRLACVSIEIDCEVGEGL